MGQRMPPSFKSTEDDTREYVADGRPASRKRRLVERIADALRVSPAALYELPSSWAAEDLGGECATLLDAYRRIQDPEERRRLLLLAQKAAEQT